eukprot:TRINITY_DN7311_c0_g1_i1.p1 TRINITY_DN7311_c0_g1~~TRINITY_DN7311_c0_g1_i1.p1  ORF type:complete len:183 (-),score=44.31 TRINITY_DN7311_c0_g1_i1:80-628(-)
MIHRNGEFTFLLRFFFFHLVLGKKHKAQVQYLQDLKNEKEEKEMVSGLRPRGLKRKVPLENSQGGKKRYMKGEDSNHVESPSTTYIKMYSTKLPNCPSYDGTSGIVICSQDYMLSRADSIQNDVSQSIGIQLESQKFLEKMTSEGWLRDKNGKFYRNPDVEWDSDEDQPELPEGVYLEFSEN